MNRLFSICSVIGAACLVVAGFLVPLFLTPPAFFPYILDTNLNILGKWLLLQALSGVAVLAGSVCLLGPAVARYRSPAALPLIALGAWLAWATTSVFVNPASGYFLTMWLPTLTAGLAVLAAPLLLTTQRRCLALLVMVLAASVIVALIGVLSSLGVGVFMKFMYGLDLAKLQDGTWLVQGGARSAAAMSTLANPEYAGTYSSAMLCIWAVVLLDGGAMLRRAGAARAAWIIRGVALVAMPLVLLHVVFTGSRQALITVALLGTLRLLLALGVRLRDTAAIFCAFVLGMITVGPLAGVLILGALIVLVLVLCHRRGDLGRLVRATDRFNLAMVVGLPLLVISLAGLYSIPGPWNPTGLRLWERFSGLLSRQDESYKERLVMFTLASRMATENPIFGVGPERYRAEYFRELSEAARNDESGAFALMRYRLGAMRGEQSHNDYLQIAAETGIIGLVLFLGAVLFVLDALVQLYRESTGFRRFLALGYLIGIGAFLSLMQSSFPLHMPSRAAVFWMLMAGAIGLVSQARLAESPEDGRKTRTEPS